MADPIYASPMVDPQVAINQLNTLYTSEHLTENYNTFFNDKTENERLVYMPEGYEDQIDFDPFQSDYGLDFKSTLESEGFVNYIKNKPVRATPQLALGPTVTLGGVLSAEELRRRMAGPIEDRSVYLDEVLPFYPGQEEGEGSVFDYWKSIPNISSFSEGLRGSLYGVTQREKEEEEAAPVATGGGVAQQSRAIFSPGRDPGRGLPDTGFMGMVDGHIGYSPYSQGSADMNAAISAKGAAVARSEGTAKGVSMFGGDGLSSYSGIGVPAASYTGGPSGQASGVSAAAAAGDGGGGGGGGGIGGFGGVGFGGGISRKHGGKITTQMNNLKKGGLAVAEPNKDASWFIRELQSKEGSDVQVLKDDGKLVGAIDMNDPNRHFIIDMVDFDSKLGIIEPHEMAMAADPRTAGQLDRKRNWGNRIQKLLEIQEMQSGRVVTKTVPPVASVQGKQDTGVVENIEQTLAAERPAPSPDMEITEQIAPQDTEADVYIKTIGGLTPPPPAARPPVEYPVSEPRSAEPAAKPVEFLAAQPDDTRSVIPAARPTTSETAQQAYERLMRERLETESGWTPPPISDAGPYPIRRAEPFVGPGPGSAKIVESVLDYSPEDYFNEIVRPLEFNTEYYESKKHFNEKTDQYIGYLDSIQEKEKQDAEEKGEVYTPTLTTFGPGFTVTGDHVGVRMSKDHVEEGALDKWEQAIESSKKLLENDDHPSAMVLAEMIYQMGEGKVSLFKDMLNALIARNGKQAKKHALYDRDGTKTKWYSQMENSGRAVAVADRLEESLSSDKNLQVGGQVPQINRSGLIQGEGGPTSDSIPMQAEPNSFIVNAPAVQMAGGAKKLDSMVNAVQKKEQTSGFNQFGNPVTGTQDINVSNGEYKIGKQAAKKIGYKKLNKMNDAGKPFVDQLDRRGYQVGGITSGFTEQEENLLNYHRDNLFGDKYLQNRDGSITTLFGKILTDQQGTAYLIPGYDSETRRKMSDEAAWKLAIETGIENYPSYPNVDEARQAEIKLHEKIDQDMQEFLRPVNLLDTPPGQPAERPTFVQSPAQERLYPQPETVNTGEKSFMEEIEQAQPMN